MTRDDMISEKVEKKKWNGKKKSLNFAKILAVRKGVPTLSLDTKNFEEPSKKVQGKRMRTACCD